MLKQANLLLVNLREIIEDLQAKNVHFQTQVEKLTLEKNKLESKNKQLIILNKSLSSEVKSLKEDLKVKYIRYVR